MLQAMMALFARRKVVIRPLGMALAAALLGGSAALFRPPALTSAEVSPFEKEVVRLLNQERAALGRSALVPEARLWNAAERHARWMAASQVMSHVGLNGSGPVDRILAAGYTRYTLVGEAVAQGYTTPAAVVAAWKASPSHWKILSDARYRDLGVGYELGPNAQPHWWSVDVGNSSDAPQPVQGSGGTSSPPPAPTSAPPPAPVSGVLRGRVLPELRQSSAGVAIVVDGQTRAVTNGAGYFEAAGIAPGKHTLDARLNGYLSARLYVVVSSSAPINAGTTRLRAGDVIIDNRIELRDLVAVSGTIGRCAGAHGYQPLYDLDQSGCITQDDVNALRRNYGATGPLAWGR